MDELMDRYYFGLVKHTLAKLIDYNSLFMAIEVNPCSSYSPELIAEWNRYFIVAVLVLKILLIVVLRVCTIMHEDQAEKIVKEVIRKKVKEHQNL